MAKVTLSNLANLQNETTAVSTINANFAALVAIIDTLVSRDGTSPNTITANLDMNSKKILNLPAASSSSEPVRKAEFDVAAGGIAAASVSAAAAAASATAAQTAQAAAEAAAAASQAGTVANNAVSTVKVQDDAITNAKLANMANNTMKARKAGSTGDPEDATLTEFLDSAAGNARGSLLVRKSSTWDDLALGSSGQVVSSDGTDVVWASLPTIPTGTIIMSAATTVPNGYLECDGTAVSRSTYAALFAALQLSSTVTITIASPGVITWTGHTLKANDPVMFTTSGALPTGLTASTTYYVVGASITANTFQVSSSAGGSAINTSGTQSGTHTAIHSPWGIGNGTTTFNVPDLRGEWVRGWDHGRGIDSNRSFGSSQSEMIGPHNHTATSSGSTSSDGAHTHTTTTYDTGGATTGPLVTTSGTSFGTATTSSNGAHTHTVTVTTTVNNNSGTENRVRNKAVMYCIKT